MQARIDRVTGAVNPWIVGDDEEVMGGGPGESAGGAGVQAGTDIQGGASDRRHPPRQLLQSAADRLRTLEAAPRPQAQLGQNAQVVSLPGRPPEPRNQAQRPGR